jgi:hypothetical protein
MIHPSSNKVKNERTYTSTPPSVPSCNVWDNFTFIIIEEVATPLISVYIILSSSGMLRSVGWFHTDVTGLHIRPIFKGQDVQDILKPTYAA